VVPGRRRCRTTDSDTATAANAVAKIQMWAAPGPAMTAPPIAGITVPTLVVVGAEDTATPPSESERIAARIPGALLRIVPDCGHSSTLGQPGTITDLLEKFLATVPHA
jgi:pimeloyl-ACP methyl ester carboxylesterase